MNLYKLVERFVGEVHEVAGAGADPFIVWCHASTTLKATSDEISWCSSALNRFAWMLRLPRSKSAAARSWLSVGVPVPFAQAQLGDVVILKRGPAPQPGPDVLNAPGHVTLYAGPTEATTHFNGLGCNQSDGITVARFAIADVLGVRRLAA